MQKNMILKTAAIVLVIIVFGHSDILAWYNDPKINTPVASKPNINQFDHSAVSDGAGGSIVTWAEKVNESDTEFDIYAQRLDSYGNPVWPVPVPVCTAPDFQGLPKIASDGTGGAIIVWHDSRGGFNLNYNNFDIYAQRITADGRIKWAVNGVPIATAPEYQVYADIAPDGMGGALISWDDGRAGNCLVFAQRVDKDGNILWQKDGVLVADVPYAPFPLPFGETDSHLVSDGFGGAIVVWQDQRELGNFDIYAQRIDRNGKRVWGDTGLPLARVDGEQFHSNVISDGLGGAIFSWTDGRSGDNAFDIFAQKVNSTGQILWPLQGLPITQAPGTQGQNAMISDGLGGAIIAWEDGREDNGYTNIYAQRVSSEGALLWDPEGVAIAATELVQITPALISDGSGGAFITWMDFYRGGTWWNIYAQHIDGSGQIKWNRNGLPVCTADDNQADPAIVSDGAGGMVIYWFDGRTGGYNNIYAQQVDRRGLLGGGEFRFYTADTDGNPKTTFAPEELILFRATWTMPAPSTPGTYQAGAGIVIHSYSFYKEEFRTYTVK